MVTSMRPAAAVAVVTALLTACGGSGGGGADGAAAGDPVRGRQLFEANCASCHGVQGEGTTTGPPLVHDYYVPSHHADGAFHVAVTRGVQPHHWDFGPMPQVPGLSRTEVDDIIAYVRSLQQEAGLIE